MKKRKTRKMKKPKPQSKRTKVQKSNQNKESEKIYKTLIQKKVQAHSKTRGIKNKCKIRANAK